MKMKPCKRNAVIVALCSVAAFGFLGSFLFAVSRGNSDMEDITLFCTFLAVFLMDWAMPKGEDTRDPV